MPAPVGGPSPAVRRLARLRLRLTLFFSLASAFGLISLTLVALYVDTGVREDALHREVTNKIETLPDGVYYSRDDELQMDSIEKAGYDTGNPMVYVYERGTYDSSGLVRVFGPKATDLDFGGAVESLARDAIGANSRRTLTASAADGTEVEMMATPVLDSDDTPQAAVVVIGDPRPYQEDVAALALVLWGVTVVLVAASFGIGYWLAGRSIAPAAEAVAQQERFLADAAHELRTPVARLRTTAEGGLVDGDPVRTAAALRSVSTLAGQAGDIVDNLLTLARMDAGAVTVKPERMRLDQLVADVVEQHAGVTYEGGSSVITADPALVRRAVDNLVTNAVRHADGRDVTVQVHGGVITVADRGPGLDPTVAPHLFERFVTSPSTGGSGLGLSIVAEIAAVHGGTIVGRNRLDGPGAEFVLSLPTPA